MQLFSTSIDPSYFLTSNIALRYSKTLIIRPYWLVSLCTLTWKKIITLTSNWTNYMYALLQRDRADPLVKHSSTCFGCWERQSARKLLQRGVCGNPNRGRWNPHSSVSQIRPFSWHGRICFSPSSCVFIFFKKKENSQKEASWIITSSVLCLWLTV